MKELGSPICQQKPEQRLEPKERLPFERNHAARCGQISLSKLRTIAASTAGYLRALRFVVEALQHDGAFFPQPREFL